MVSVKKQIVVLGGGFAAFQTAKRLSSKLCSVTLISKSDHFLFTPLLASATVGTVKLESISEPLCSVRNGVRALVAECTRIDLHGRTVSCRSADNVEFNIAFDELVVAVGATTNTFDIPGASTVAISLRDAESARTIRHRILKSFAEASIPGVSAETRRNLLSFVVVGGGPTGVEFAAELYDFISNDLIAHYEDLRPDVKITLVEASDAILSSFHQRLRSYTQKHFIRQRISLVLNAAVARVDEQGVTLKDGTQISSGIVIWSAGVKQTPLIEQLAVEKDERGRVRVDERLQIVGQTGVYAIGDCAVVSSQPLPMTGQVAQQQGKYLANAINRRLKGKSVRPFRYFHQGMLTYIGSHRALAETPGGRVRGLLAWVLWRSVYLTKLVSVRNKIKVLLDWLHCRIFGRDLSAA